MKTLLLPVLATALAAVLALPAAAIVPPKNCGRIEVKNRTHQIKADGVTCKFAKRTARRFLREGDEPKRYTCRKYKKSQTSLSFKCDRGTSRSVFGIRR